jgi:YVTN family beta-propeller protein
VQVIPHGKRSTVFVRVDCRNRIYVADPTGNQLVIIDGATNAVTTVGGGGTYLWRLAVNPLTNQIFAVNLISQDVTVFSGPVAGLPVLLLELVQPKSASN